MQANFYKTFTRPVAKVLLVAVLTYQLVYWSWMKLETDEIRAETAGQFCPNTAGTTSEPFLTRHAATIADLEAKVDEYKKTTASDKSK